MHVECGARILRVSTLPPMPGLLHHESFSFTLAKVLLKTGEFLVHTASLVSPALTCFCSFLLLLTREIVDAPWMDICCSLEGFSHVYIDLDPRLVILQDILSVPTSIFCPHTCVFPFSALRGTISSIGVHQKCVSTCRFFLPLALLDFPTALLLQGLDFVQLLRILKISLITPSMLQ